MCVCVRACVRVCVRVCVLSFSYGLVKLPKCWLYVMVKPPHGFCVFGGKEGDKRKGGGSEETEREGGGTERHRERRERGIAGVGVGGQRDTERGGKEV